MKLRDRHQCGWCPTLLPDDPFEWSRHQFEVHGQLGWSVRFIAGGDWHVSELVPDASEADTSE